MMDPAVWTARNVPRTGNLSHQQRHARAAGAEDSPALVDQGLSWGSRCRGRGTTDLVILLEDGGEADARWVAERAAKSLTLPMVKCRTAVLLETDTNKHRTPPPSLVCP